jgi:glutamine amidotransferase
MCRMFGFLSAQPITGRWLLRDSPRSLWALAREHRDGWGVAIRESTEWVIRRSIECAQVCTRYDDMVASIQTQLMIAHVRQKTRGEVKLTNTHPFRRGDLVFGHNGTVQTPAPLVARTSSARLAEIEGDTDSEQLFAFIATRIDETGDVETGVVEAVREIHALGSLGELGSTSFLISSGQRIYAHRFGRSLDLLIRRGERRTEVIAVASEPLTDETWTQLPERSLCVLESVDGALGSRMLIG